MPLDPNLKVGSFEEPWNDIFTNNISSINADIDNLNVEKRLTVCDQLITITPDNIKVNRDITIDAKKINFENPIKFKWNSHEINKITFNPDDLEIKISSSITIIYFDDLFFDRNIDISLVPHNTTIRIYFVTSANKFNDVHIKSDLITKSECVQLIRKNVNKIKIIVIDNENIIT